MEHIGFRLPPLAPSRGSPSRPASAGAAVRCRAACGWGGGRGRFSVGYVLTVHEKRLKSNRSGEYVESQSVSRPSSRHRTVSVVSCQCRVQSVESRQTDESEARAERRRDVRVDARTEDEESGDAPRPSSTGPLSPHSSHLQSLSGDWRAAGAAGSGVPGPVSALMLGDRTRPPVVPGPVPVCGESGERDTHAHSLTQDVQFYTTCHVMWRLATPRAAATSCSTARSVA